MATSIIYGVVGADGERKSGTGFTSSKGDKTGLFTINFDTPFKHVPAMTGSQINYGDDDQNTRDNVLFPHASPSSVTVKTGNDDGKGSYREFSFIAIGDQ